MLKSPDSGLFAFRWVESVNRKLATVRHLRRVYVDPITSKPEWGIVRAPDGGIMGVYSLAAGSTIKRSGFLYRDRMFENTKRYTDWRFVYEPSLLPVAFN